MGFFALLKQRAGQRGIWGVRLQNLFFCFCGIIPVIALLHAGQNLTSGHYSVLLGSAELSYVLLRGTNVFDLIPQSLQLCTSEIGFGTGMLSCMSKA